MKFLLDLYEENANEQNKKRTKQIDIPRSWIERLNCPVVSSSQLDL